MVVRLAVTEDRADGEASTSRAGTGRNGREEEQRETQGRTERSQFEGGRNIIRCSIDCPDRRGDVFFFCLFELPRKGGSKKRERERVDGEKKEKDDRSDQRDTTSLGRASLLFTRNEVGL